MAQISLHVDGRILVQPMNPDNPCLSIGVNKDIDGFSEHPIPYGRDTLLLHGEAAHMRAFAEAILAALPAEARSEDR